MTSDGLTLAIGAQNFNDKGAVFVYTSDGSTWTQSA